MEMNFIEGTCPKCGAKTREQCNTWVYGSPIRTCGSCKTEYLDKRWREVAIDGFDPRSNNSSFYLKGFFGFLLFTLLCGAWLFWEIRHGRAYPSKLLGCVLVGTLATLLCGFLYLRIKLGFEARNNAKFLEESKQRLQNPNYVRKLIAYGYDISEEDTFS
ncbi:MAG: hypothetical protein PUG54_08580 [Firmicutes bacterium]|nr:hypothetical protein [Bacillota bacterium]